MFLVLKKGVLKKIVSIALEKAGNIRDLANEIGIPRSTLSSYHMESIAVRKEKFDKILAYVGSSFDEKNILETLPVNWRQIKGGKKCVEIKKKSGTYKKQLIECQKNLKKLQDINF